jgi:hypothetical protein
VIDSVSEEGTSDGLRCQFMRCLGGEVGIVDATEHPQVLIGGGDTVKSDIRAGFLLGRWFSRYVVAWSPSIQ